MGLVTHVGGAESDSFITVDQADTLLESLPDDTTEWEDLSSTEKEFRLQIAAQLMGHLPLRGRTVYRNQALCFPRTCQQLSARGTIPTDIKRAQAFMAYSVVHRALRDRAPIEDENPWAFGTPKSISLSGLVSVTFGDAPTGGGTLIDRLLRSLPFPVYQLMKQYTSQIRGGSVVAEDDVRTLSTTTTTILVMTTTSTV